MVLANRAKLQNSRSLVRVFGGLNETYACSEAEYSAGVNFSARDFPALSTRKPRRKLRELTGLNGMYHLNGLLTVCGKDLIYTPDADGANPVTCTEAVTDGKKALVGIGTKILIFPDKVAFDTADGSVSALGAVWQAEGQSVQFAPCDAAGKAYEVSGYGKEEPEKPADGQLFLKVEDEEHPWASTSTLEEYSASSGSWTAVPLEYCRITAAGAQRLFAQWDTVTVQGTAAQQAGMWTKLDGDLVVYDVLENGLRVRVSPEGDHVYGTLVQSAESAQWTSLDGKETRSFAVSTPVRMERRVPDLDYVTECDNRVWGCSSKENVIYACRLGDPVGQALERAEELRPGSRIALATRQAWLKEADAMLRERFFKNSITDAYDDVGADLAWDDSLQDDDVLLAPAPFDALYPHYLCAMTDAALGETDRYVGEQAQYNSLLADLAAWLRRSYPTLTGAQWRW